MLIVTGSLTATTPTRDRFLERALAHVRRSRAEHGCLEHGVAIDAEEPLRLMFFERWRDHAALEAHFPQPGSIAFVTAIRREAAGFDGPHIFTVADA